MKKGDLSLSTNAIVVLNYGENSNAPTGTPVEVRNHQYDNYNS